MKQPDKPYWTSAEAGEWKSFLGTETGKKLLRYLAEGEPYLLPGGGVNEILIRSGEVKQHKEILSTLIELTGADISEPPALHSDETYPPLTDDERWDGPKLNQPQE